MRHHDMISKHPDTKNLWEKSLKYNINVDSSHPTNTSSLKVSIFASGYSGTTTNLEKRI